MPTASYRFFSSVMTKPLREVYPLLDKWARGHDALDRMTCYAHRNPDINNNSYVYFEFATEKTGSNLQKLLRAALDPIAFAPFRFCLNGFKTVEEMKEDKDYAEATSGREIIGLNFSEWDCIRYTNDRILCNTMNGDIDVNYRITNRRAIAHKREGKKLYTLETYTLSTTAVVQPDALHKVYMPKYIQAPVSSVKVEASKTSGIQWKMGLNGKLRAEFADGARQSLLHHFPTAEAKEKVRSVEWDTTPGNGITASMNQDLAFTPQLDILTTHFPDSVGVATGADEAEAADIIWPSYLNTERFSYIIFVADKNMQPGEEVRITFEAVTVTEKDEYNYKEFVIPPVTNRMVLTLSATGAA